VLRGNDPVAVAGQIVRGQRVFCSDRGQRGGCGKTFPLFLVGILPRHTFNAALLWALLQKLLGGATIKAAAETLRLPFSLEAVYGIVRRCRQRLAVVRSYLSREAPAPVSGQTDPLGQTLEHLQQIFAPVTAPTGDALAAYQRHFQRPFLG
jgi:hypothetical protein